MSNIESAYQTQIQNIQKKTGKSLVELTALIQKSGLTKHSEIRSMLMQELGVGYGDANTLVHYVLKSDGERAAQAQGLSIQQVLDEIYSGGKAHLRPIHERLMQAIEPFGEFETAPKKGYLSLRRVRQFAMLGPASNQRVEVGINLKDLEAKERLVVQPAGSMCNYKVKLTAPEEVDQELIGWLEKAYHSAG